MFVLFYINIKLFTNILILYVIYAKKLDDILKAPYSIINYKLSKMENS